MFQSSRELLRIMSAKALGIVWKDSKNIADGSEPPIKDRALGVIQTQGDDASGSLKGFCKSKN